MPHQGTSAIGKPDNIKNLLAPHCPFKVDVTKIANVWWTTLLFMYVQSLAKIRIFENYLTLLYAFCLKSKCYYNPPHLFNHYLKLKGIFNKSTYNNERMLFRKLLKRLAQRPVAASVPSPRTP